MRVLEAVEEDLMEGVLLVLVSESELRVVVVTVLGGERVGEEMVIGAVVQLLGEKVILESICEVWAIIPLVARRGINDLMLLIWTVSVLLSSQSMSVREAIIC